MAATYYLNGLGKKQNDVTIINKSWFYCNMLTLLYILLFISGK